MLVLSAKCLVNISSRICYSWQFVLLSANASTHHILRQFLKFQHTAKDRDQRQNSAANARLRLLNSAEKLRFFDCHMKEKCVLTKGAVSETSVFFEHSTSASDNSLPSSRKITLRTSSIPSGGPATQKCRDKTSSGIIQNSFLRAFQILYFLTPSSARKMSARLRPCERKWDANSNHNRQAHSTHPRCSRKNAHPRYIQFE